MSLLKKIVRDQVLGISLHAAQAGGRVDVDLTTEFGRTLCTVAGEDIGEHVLVTRRKDGKVYEIRTGKRMRVWRWQS